MTDLDKARHRATLIGALLLLELYERERDDGVPWAPAMQVRHALGEVSTEELQIGVINVSRTLLAMLSQLGHGDPTAILQAISEDEAKSAGMLE